MRSIDLGWRQAAAVIVLLAALGAEAVGQPAAERQRPRSNEVVTAGEVSRLFDAYAILQAQEMLQLDEAKFGSFVTRLKALQEARRRHLRARTLIIQDLQRLLRDADPPPEAALKDRVEALAQQDAAARVEVQRAADAVDEVLDVRQRARFRVFEHQLELRRLELLARVRQQNRANRQRPSGSR